jgi:hypothetical protein
MNDSIEILCPDDVIHTGASALMFQCTFKVSEFLAMMQSKLEEEHLFAEGMSCDVLQPNQPWRQGKVRISLQFIASDSEAVEESPTLSQSNLDPQNSINGVKINVDPEKFPPPLQRQTRKRKNNCVGMWS